MKKIKKIVGVAFLWTYCISLAFSQELNILVIGSSHSFSERGEANVVDQKAFNPAAIATELQRILSQDTAVTSITPTVNVEFENIYKNKSIDVEYSANNFYPFYSHCYSLAQHYMWPDGKTERLANLRGEGDHVWDRIVICFDPYIIGNFPGMLAEGVKLIQSEVAKSANPAEILLLAQWPENGSIFSANQFNEIVYRVGNSAGLTVVPAGKAWANYGAQDTNIAHPTPKGAYLAAAAIYSQFFPRSAKTSGYIYPGDGAAMADHALSVVQANTGVPQYAGKYSVINPFQIKYVDKRIISYNHTGTSTERRIALGLDRLDAVMGMRFTSNGYQTSTNATRWDFNFGRGNDNSEDDKDYSVNPAKFDRSYGFPMHHYSQTATSSMPYGIDKQYIYGSYYEDGTDLGIAYNMIRPGTREMGLPADVRAIPIRLMWLKMREVDSGVSPVDGIHMSDQLNNASASFIYTLLSGRCPVTDEPAIKGSEEWVQWLGHKIGYETAWQMSHLTTRVPGLRILPSNQDATTLSSFTTETMTVRFAYPPQEDVTVTVSVDNPAAAIVSTQTLTFTTTNYNTPQKVYVTGLPGATTSADFKVVYNTSSDDEVFDNLSDSWAYTNLRTSTAAVTQITQVTKNVTVSQFTPKIFSLDVTGANASNTAFAGPSHGTISWSSGNLLYTPSGDYLGNDQIFYAVTINGTQRIGIINLSVVLSPGQVNLTATDASAAEQNRDPGRFVISRVGSTSSALSVSFSMSGNATQGVDYTLSNSSPITIPAGQSSFTITLTPVDDSVYAEVEAATMTVTPSASYSIGLASATVNILDNDNRAPVVNAGVDQMLTLSESVWSPSQSKPQLWLDAADATTLTLNSSKVTEWRDKSGYNRHATQSTSVNQPTLIPAGLNGVNVLSFDGNSDFLALGRGLDFIADSPHFSFIVFADPTQLSAIYGSALEGYGSASFAAGFASPTQYMMEFTEYSHTPPFSSQFAPAGSILNYGWDTGLTREIRANGKLDSSAIDAPSIDPLIGGGQIGYARQRSYLGGKIGEMIFLSEKPSDDNRKRMEGYLAHKWGLTANLDFNHPFKIQPPRQFIAITNLNGIITDADGHTPSALWTLVSGPAPVNFGNQNAASTTVRFDEVGTYLLRLTADDQTAQVFDEITITVEMHTPVLGGPLTKNIGVVDALVQCTLLSANADVTLVWAETDQGESTVAQWRSALGGGSKSIPSISEGDLIVNLITGLTSGKTYHYRFFAKNPDGEDWSVVNSFTTREATASALINLGWNWSYTSNNQSHRVSVYPGTAGYEGKGDGEVSTIGPFGDNTVEAYAFFRSGSNGNNLTAYASGGTSITGTATTAISSSGSSNPKIWETTNPAGYTTTANYTSNTEATGFSATNSWSGRIDISNYSSGRIYFLYGSYRSVANDLDLTMKDTNGSKPDIQLLDAGTTDQANNYQGYVSEILFVNKEGYDVIEYKMTNTKLRVTGIVVDGVPNGGTHSTYLGWASSYPSLTSGDQSIDFDNGGLSTGIEWVVGGNPTDGSDDTRNTPTIDNSDQAYVTFSYKRRDAAEADPNTDILVEYGSSLTTWRNHIDHGVADGLLIDDSTDLGGGFHEVTVSIPRARAENNKLFVRLSVNLR